VVFNGISANLIKGGTKIGLDIFAKIQLQERPKPG